MPSANASRKIDSFRTHVRAWYRANKRDLPWRATRDPYAVLVSEVMLQQTQVERVVPKYRAFLERFPTLQALAKAELGDVLRAWQGLGYNRRAKMLWKLAREPESIKLLYGKQSKSSAVDPALLETLPGIGHYTASALVAFAWNRDAVAFDTNLRRVHTRYFGTAVDAERVARDALPRGHAREWNNALMDFGSAVCAKTPRCGACPLRRSCDAFRTKRFTVVVPKQTAFRESNRFYRGAILRALHDDAKTRAQLRAIGDAGKLDIALAQLEHEGIVRRTRDRYRL